LGGVLATSAHGSGYQAKSGIWDTLLEITWVDGTGKVRHGVLGMQRLLSWHQQQQQQCYGHHSL
jgi:hypothetical protein